MADDKNAVADGGTHSPASSDRNIPAQELESPAKGRPWMYKRLRLGPLALPAYASPLFQVIFVALVCFLCPGMFNAVNGLGAGGGISAHDINNANTALYSTFAGVGFFCGSIANRIGLRLTLGIGGFGYFLYVASILSYNHNGNAGFLIFAGALLGLCAAMLWTAQGAVMLSYPPEKSKGKYIALFWTIFNLGAVIGALVSGLELSPATPLTSSNRYPSARTFTPKPTPLPTEPTLHSWFSWRAASSSRASSATPSLSNVATAPMSSS